MTWLQPTVAWIDGAFQTGVAIDIDHQGKIGRIADQLDLSHSKRETVTLANTALIPGFVNAHSHAFQIGLRGLGESYSDPGGDFWSWRQAMYALVDDLTGDRFEALCLRAFREMLAAGITTVGEFHYLHHLQDIDFALDRRLLAAARQAGIRIAPLVTYYQSGGIDRPLEPSQLRFSTPNPELYWAHQDALAKEFDETTIHLGAAIHSIRAAAAEEVIEIAQEAKQRGLVCHMHLEEQPLEISDCKAQYGIGPLTLLLDRGAVNDRFTAVHLTHSQNDEAQEFFARGGRACICPITEANLGDGIPTWDLATATDSLCLGSDSNVHISMLQELRWLEYGQRLRSGQRGVVRKHNEPAPALLQAATIGGARSLGVASGAIRSGLWADFCALNLGHPVLSGWTPENLASMLAFSAGDEVVAATWVGGKKVYSR